MSQQHNKPPVVDYINYLAGCWERWWPQSKEACRAFLELQGPKYLNQIEKPWGEYGYYLVTSDTGDDSPFSGDLAGLAFMEYSNNGSVLARHLFITDVNLDGFFKKFLNHQRPAPGKSLSVLVSGAQVATDSTLPVCTQLAKRKFQRVALQESVLYIRRRKR